MQLADAMRWWPDPPPDPYCFRRQTPLRVQLLLNWQLATTTTTTTTAANRSTPEQLFDRQPAGWQGCFYNKRVSCNKWPELTSSWPLKSANCKLRGERKNKATWFEPFHLPQQQQQQLTDENTAMQLIDCRRTGNFLFALPRVGQTSPA